MPVMTTWDTSHLNVTDMEAQRKFWTVMFEAVPLKRDTLQGVKVPGMC